jgi:O-antigen ligase
VASNRYEYWRVALRAFGDTPINGAGAGGFRVAWLQERPVREAVRDTHSLEFEVAAELGIVGLLVYVALLAAATRLLYLLTKRNRALGLGATSVFLALFVHSLFYAGFFEDPIVWGVVGVAAWALGVAVSAGAGRLTPAGCVDGSSSASQSSGSSSPVPAQPSTSSHESTRRESSTPS